MRPAGIAFSRIRGFGAGLWRGYLRASRIIVLSHSSVPSCCFWFCVARAQTSNVLDFHDHRLIAPIISNSTAFVISCRLDNTGRGMAQGMRSDVVGWNHPGECFD
jgi:hypothetical protein